MYSRYLKFYFISAALNQQRGEGPEQQSTGGTSSVNSNQQSGEGIESSAKEQSSISEGEELVPVTGNSEAQISIQTPKFEGLSIPIEKNKPSNKFDNAVLLNLIPKSYKKKAEKLLLIISQFPSEITWNDAGNIFIDGTSIPLSNIFIIFPLLFKKIQSPEKYPGLAELKLKLRNKGFSSFFESKSAKVRETKPKNQSKVSVDKKSLQWWYIGD